MIVEWTVIGIFVLLGMIFLKLEHHFHKFKALLLVIVALIIYFSLVGLFNSEDVDTSSPSGIINGVYLYVGWMGETLSSIWDIGANTVSLVGNAVKVNVTQEDERPRR